VANPLVVNGNLNLLAAAVTWNDFAGLNVTASYLDKAGITLRLEGQTTVQHETLTDIVQSPQPYMPVSLVISLLRTQQLSDLYKTQMESDAIIGEGTVWPDVSTGTGLSPYQIDRMAIQSVGELSFAGQTPIWGVSLRGRYLVNSNAFGG
jgi:hypothetical protein